MNNTQLLQRTRFILVFYSLALLISGATAIPLRFELGILDSIFGIGSAMEQALPSLAEWITVVHSAIEKLYVDYPFLLYGYDWLAFGHFVIGISFLGAVKDPVRNRWVVEYGIIACIFLVPYALIMGAIRDVPLGWRFIDSLFGLFGIIPLLLARKMIKTLETSRVAVE
jgi:hypothetical protein